MKNLFIILLLLPSFNSFAQQDNTETNNFFAFNATTSMNTISDVGMQGNGRRNNCTNGLTVTANILAAIGGGLIGWPIGTALGGGEPEWVMAAVGAGVLAIGIPLNIIGKKRCGGRYGIVSGDDMYVAKSRPLQLGIAGTGNTVGLQLTF